MTGEPEASTDGAKPVRPSDQFALARVADPQLHPDGDRVAYVHVAPDSEDSYRSAIHTVSVDGGDPTPFEGGDPKTYEGGDPNASMDGDGASQPHWSPDGEHLAFVSARGDGKRGQVWVAPADGGPARQVTDVAGGATGIAWSPAGDAIAFLQERTQVERDTDADRGMGAAFEESVPDPRVFEGRLVLREEGGRHPTRHWTPWYDGRTHVYVVDLEDGAGEADGADGTAPIAGGAVTRVSDGDYDCRSLAWGGPDDLYYTARPGGDDDVRHELRVFDRRDGTTAVVTEFSHSEIWTPAVAATADGRVAHTSMPAVEPTSHQTDVVVVERATGDSTTVTAGIDHTISRNTVPCWDDAGDHLYFLTLEAGSVVLRRNTVSTDPPERVLGGDGGGDGGGGGGDGDGITGPSDRSDVSLAGDRVAFVGTGWDHLGDVVVADLDGTAARRLTRVNESVLAARAFEEPEEIRFDSADGEFPVQGWVLHPPDFDPDGSYPLVVSIHGGPHAMATKESNWVEFHSLAAAGYVVCWPNYRGSTGYGEAFQRANVADWGGADFDDVLAACEFVAARDYVDEARVFVTGESFGGSLAGWAATASDRFAAAVPKSGIYSLPFAYGTTDKFKFMEWEFGSTPLDDPDAFWERSALAHAHRASTPTLIVVGDQDHATPLADAECFYHYLTKAGVPTRLVVYPDEGHELLNDGRSPAHIVDRIERTIDWFDRWGGAGEDQ